MEKVVKRLNDILVQIFWNILRSEERALKKYAPTDLSISEVHLIEAVCKNEESGATISGIAHGLEITKPSVTVAINKLESKGYVEKGKCCTDGRSVRVRLTSKGRQVQKGHDVFHMDMARTLVKELSEQEKEALLCTIEKLNEYFVLSQD